MYLCTLNLMGLEMLSHGGTHLAEEVTVVLTFETITDDANVFISVAIDDILLAFHLGILIFHRKIKVFWYVHSGRIHIVNGMFLSFASQMILCYTTYFSQSQQHLNPRFLIPAIKYMFTYLNDRCLVSAHSGRT